MYCKTNYLLNINFFLSLQLNLQFINFLIFLHVNIVTSIIVCTFILVVPI